MVLTDTRVYGLAAGEVTFYVTQFPTVKSMRMLTRLGALLGPSLAQAFAALKPTGSTFGIEGASLADAFRTFFASADESKIEPLIKELIDGAKFSVGEKTGDLTLQLFNTMFQGNLREAFNFLGFIVQHNYGDFIGAMLAKGKEAQALASKPPSQGSNTSAINGPFTESANKPPVTVP